METVLITGGTGMVGKHITSFLLQQGYAVIILTRKLPEQQSTANTSYALWNVETKMIDTDAVQQADHIIHLAGAGVMDKKWTAAYKQEIIDSRVKSAQLIIETLSNISNKVKTVISASAIGWYGADTVPPKPFTEEAPADSHFLGEVCRLWEAAMEPVTALNIRLVKLRIGIVLSLDGGALQEFIQSLKFGVASILGNGRQVVSWVHIDDLASLCLFALQHTGLNGSYNAVAPAPVTNKALMTLLAKKRNGSRFIKLPVPAFMLKLLLGGRSIEILKSATVSSKKIQAAGFHFKYETLQPALNDLLKKIKDRQ